MHCLRAQNLAKDVHEWDGSGDALVGEKTGHGDHSGTSILHFYNLVSGSVFFGHILSKTQHVKVQVTRSLGGLSSEVVSRMSDTFSFADSNEEKDSGKPSGLLLSKDSKSLCPVRFFGESRDVHTQSHTTLLN
ncbi:unnamed protein product [Pseudo-nitzschia multistriata]|uniref:Uncharacterized protein n=1 Tax=Pseudo-nitzschia multistriata TaxID=183589 RepID=A0A448ZBD9_9STRA|nr:unnamed protein product [Pseudo-nitzschia multistriata]